MIRSISPCLSILHLATFALPVGGSGALRARHGQARSTFPPRRPPSSAPTATSATASRSRIRGTGCAIPKYPEVDDPDVLAYLQGGERLFRGLEEAAPGADRPAVRGDEGADQGGRQLGPDPRRRFPLLVGVQAGRAVPDLVPQAGRAAATTRSSSTSRSRPRARNISGSARSRSAPTASCSRRLPTMTGRSGSSCASATLRPARTSRRSPRSASASRCGPATAPASSSPRSTTIGAAIARAITGSAAPTDEDVTLYEETEELGFSVGVGKIAGPEPDLRLDRRQCDERSAVRVRRRSVAAADADLAPQAEPRISCRRGAREIVDPHQRRPCEFPARRGRSSRSPEEWRTVIAGSDRVYLTGVTSYRDHLAISSRVDGLDQLVLRTYAGEETRIPFEEASYSAFFHRQSRVRARQPIGSAIRRWSRRRRPTIITRRAASSRCARSRRSRRATTRRNMRPSG